MTILWEFHINPHGLAATKIETQWRLKMCKQHPKLVKEIQHNKTDGNFIFMNVKSPTNRMNNLN